MKLLPGSSNFHTGTGSSDIKYQQLSGLGLLPLVCMSMERQETVAKVLPIIRPLLVDKARC